MPKRDGGQRTQIAEQEQPRGALAHREEFFPSLFSPREFFAANPFELMQRFTEEMNRFWGGWRGYGAGEAGTWAPAVEVFERDGNLVMRAELPGLNKEDVKVEVTEDTLTIQGERKREREERHEGFYRSERSYGRFYRQIPLPAEVHADEARAGFKDGVLEVSMPIPETQRKRREIPIEAKSGQ